MHSEISAIDFILKYGKGPQAKEADSAQVVFPNKAVLYTANFGKSTRPGPNLLQLCGLYLFDYDSYS